MALLRVWALAFLVCSLLTVVSVAFIDHPVASMVFNETIARLLFDLLARTPRFLATGGFIISFAAGTFVLAHGTPQRRLRLTMEALSSAILAYAATAFALKPWFARTDPMVWVWHHRDQFFAAAGGDYSFPSGHSAVMAAMITVLWAAQAQDRPVYIVLSAAVAIGLIVLDVHFVSDVIAGCLVGASAALLVIVLSKNIRRLLA
jgi:undecaprenyl-diphosphatase